MHSLNCLLFQTLGVVKVMRCDETTKQRNDVDATTKRRNGVDQVSSVIPKGIDGTTI